MAVDTAEKRYSMMNIGQPKRTIFEPDGAVDLDDRQHLLDCYSGIAFGPPAGGPNADEFDRGIYRGLAQGIGRGMY